MDYSDMKIITDVIGIFVGTTMSGGAEAPEHEVKVDTPYHYECAYKDSGMMKRVELGDAETLCEPKTLINVYEG